MLRTVADRTSRDSSSHGAALLTLQETDQPENEAWPWQSHSDGVSQEALLRDQGQLCEMQCGMRSSFFHRR